MFILDQWTNTIGGITMELVTVWDKVAIDFGKIGPKY